MVAHYPSGSNTFVKDHMATGNLVINFSRNSEDFALNRYVQIRPVEKEAGYYLELTVEESGRILHSNLDDFVWADGADAPSGEDGTEAFLFKDYRTLRRAYRFSLGDKAVDQAGWDIVETHLAVKAQQAMTARTQLVFAELSDASRYDATQVSAAAAIAGNSGNWAASTSEKQDIKRSLNHAADRIANSTLDAVRQEDLVLVIGPGTAKLLAESPEIIAHLKGSPEAGPSLRGEGPYAPGRNVRYGLPERLYGFELVVEGTRKVTSRKRATPTRAPIWADGVAALVARPGDLVAGAGGPSFSTCTLFAFEEMSVEVFHDSWQRKTRGRITDDVAVVLTAPAAGFLFTEVV